MLRTKDLVLFAVALLFLLAGIFYTLGLETGGVSQQPAEVAFDTTDLTAAEATAPGAVVDRRSTIERLQAALAKDEQLLLLAPEVIEPVVASATPTTAATTTPVSTDVIQCPVMRDGVAYATTWPANARLMLENDSRVVVSEVMTAPATSTASSTASTTTSTAESVTYLTTPILPGAGATYCLASAVIGVAVDGQLIFNEDARTYQSAPATELIGYARDGHPIYGNFNGVVDECGGYTLGAQYRYTVSPDRDTIVSCYRGVPQDFADEI